MLTGKLVRVRHQRDRRLVPQYVDPNQPQLLELAGSLIDLFSSLVGRTRREMEQEVAELLGNLPNPLIAQGLAKLLEDRGEFEVDSALPPEQIREVTFRIAQQTRAEAMARGQSWNRAEAIRQTAAELGIDAHRVEMSLFADLKDEQRFLKFEPLTPEGVLHRYNLALAQAVLLRATEVNAHVVGETAARYRSLFRSIRFHRLICVIRHAPPDGCHLRLDGPMSLFGSTLKYGLQLALFLPVLVQCRNYRLEAKIRWGAERSEKIFELSHEDGLVSHLPDYGDYIPKDLLLFVESFRKNVPDFDISSEVQVFRIGDTFWVPDFQLRHRTTGKVVWLEVAGFWRKVDVEKRFRDLVREMKEPFLLAVTDPWCTENPDSQALLTGILRFKRTPLAQEVAERARTALNLPSGDKLIT